MTYMLAFWRLIGLPKIPFNRPSLAGPEGAYIAEALQGMHISGDGVFTRRCQAILERELGGKKALLTTSCTDALEMAALLLDIKPGDEVIVPSFTFVSTANAFVLRGARPRFIDIRPDTLNLDESQLEALIGPRTAAIVPVHYGGIACEMDAIMEIARGRSIPIVEDNAHGLFGRYQDRPLGSFGCLATQSFHETKNFSCGEGGALIINEERMIERAEILREKGTNRSRFFRGEIDKYSWVDVGSSFLLSDLLAAFLCAQLEARAQIQEKRKRLWDFYAKELTEWANHLGAGLPTVPPNCLPSYHLFYLILPSLEIRQRLIAFLATRNINSVFHYQSLHLSEMGLRFGGFKGECPVTERMSDRLLRLPFFNDMSQEEQIRVVEALHEFQW